MHLLASNIAQPIAVCIKAHMHIQRSLSSGPPYAYSRSSMPATRRCLLCCAQFDTLVDLAFPVISTSSNTHSSSRHTPALISGSIPASFVEADVFCGIFKAEPWAIGFGVGLAVILRCFKCRISNTVCISEVFLVMNATLVRWSCQINMSSTYWSDIV